MKVEVLEYSGNPEYACAIAMRSTRLAIPAHEITLKREEINRLLREAKVKKHFGVFEHAYFTVSVEAISRVCTHQLVRHRLFSFMQTSGRVIDASLATFVIPPSIIDAGLYDEFLKHCIICREFTKHLEVVHKIPREDARYAMPEAIRQNIVISGNARQWMHFLWMRASEGSHAQWEIKEMARHIHEELRDIAPVIFEEVFEC